MPESAQSSSDGTIGGRTSARLPEWTVPTVLGLVAGVLAALFVTVHWSIAVVGAIIVVILSAARNERFLMMMVFLVPVGWTLKPGLPVREVAMAARFLTVAGFFLGCFWRGELNLRRLWRSRITRASFLFCAAALGSIVFGTDGATQDSVHAFYRLASYIAFYLLLLVWVDTKQRLKRIAAVILGSMVFIALYGMVQLLAGGYTSLWLYLNPPGPGFTPWSGRIPSLLNYPNSLAGYLNLILPLALACWVLPTGKRLKIVAGVGFVLGTVTLLFSQSLGGIVAFGCAGTLAGFWLFRDLAKRLAWLGGLVVLGTAIFSARALLNPSHSAVALGSDLGTRLLLWASAWHFFVHSPAWGIGWGNFVGAYGRYLNLSWMQSGVFEVHNIYLQLLSETGVVGFIAFFGLIFFTLREAWRQMREPEPLEMALAFGCFGAVVTVLVHGLVDFLFEVSPPFGTLFWMLLALLVVNGRLQKASRARKTIMGRENETEGATHECA